MAHRKQLARELGQRQSAAAAAAAAAELPYGGTGRAMAVEAAAAELCCTGRAMGSQEQGAYSSHPYKDASTSVRASPFCSPPEIQKSSRLFPNPNPKR